MEQKITSAATSVNTLNHVYKLLPKLYEKGKTILDYGCGKYRTNEEYAKANGFKWYGYDPYNRDDNSNREALEISPDIIVCSNVLNVLESESLIDKVIDSIIGLCKTDTDIYFTIYEGNRSGNGKETSKGYQQNKKTEWYLRKLKEVLDCKRKLNIIKARRYANG